MSKEVNCNGALTIEQLSRLFIHNGRGLYYYPNGKLKDVLFTFSIHLYPVILEWYPGGGNKNIIIKNPTLKLLWLMGYRG